MKTNKFLTLALAVMGAGMIQWSCSKNEDSIEPVQQDPNAPKGQVRIGVTDAPIDNAEVKGAFVTITEVRVGGRVFDAFKGPKTINIAELNNGNFLTLGEGQLQAGTYSKLTFFFDYEKDAMGNAPGSYILKADGTKSKLVISGNARNYLDLNTKPFTINQDGTTDLMVDFDLRKAIKTFNENAQKQYSFVTYGELQSSIRVVNKTATGTISGQVSGYNSATMGNVVAFVYKKGEFNQNVETKGQGESAVEFKNAVSSAKVDAAGNFKVSFLEEGDYEIHFASFKSSGEANSSVALNSFLNLSGNLDLTKLSVKSSTEVRLSLSIKGFLGL